MHPELAKPGKPGNSQWHVLAATWLGEMFDGMDASICVLVLFPALSELMKTQSHSEVGVYGSITLAVFMVGWALGSIIFGVLADQIGRSKTMMITILLYAICTALCGTANSWQELAFYRFLVGCGIGGEITIGAVMLAEQWKGKSRIHATAALSTSFGVGYLIAAVLNYFVGPFGWRWLFFAGVAPALVTVYIRSKLDEPEQFKVVQQMRKELKRSKKHTKSVAEIEKHMAGFSLMRVFAKENRFKVFMVVLLASTSIIGYWAVLAWIPPWVNQLTGTAAVAERSQTAIVMNIGSIAAAALGGVVIERFGRANSFRLSFVGALFTCIGMFTTVKVFGNELLCWVFFVGAFATLPFTVLFVYVPELFDTSMRSTAFGFSVQLGRIFAACAALLGGQIIATFGGSYAAAGSTVACIYVVGAIASFFMPKTTGEVELSFNAYSLIDDDAQLGNQVKQS